MIVARAPLRISFGGGGTDLPAYYERYGGMVLSTTIQSACHVRIEEHAGQDVIITSRDYQRTVTIRHRHPVTIEEPLSLPRAVIAWFAARGQRPPGMHVVMHADVPPGSGLGSSSAMTAALVAAIARYIGLPLTRRELAEIACEVEIDILRRPIGRQDQYASAFGGLNLLTFSRNGVEVASVRLKPEVVRSLEEHILIMSTRQTRDSGTLLRAQRAASTTDLDVIERLHGIKRLAAAMHEALLVGDLPRFGALLDENWQLKRGLSQGVTSAEIDGWYQAAQREGAYGGKLAGAGGGGHFIFCVPPARRAQVIGALADAGLTLCPAALDAQGCVTYGEVPIHQRTSRVDLQVKGTRHEIASPIPS